MYGRVTKYYHDRGYGFIRGDEGDTYSIHHSNLKGEYIDSGYYVSFNHSRMTGAITTPKISQ